MATTNKPTLANRVQSLPQELFDEIFELTLTTPPTVAINAEYKTPLQLRLNRASRKKFARKYYTQTTFAIVLDYSPEADRRFRKWLRSLPRAHLQYLKKLKIDGGELLSDNRRNAACLLGCACAQAVLVADALAGVDAYEHAIRGESSLGDMGDWKTNIVVKNSDGEATVEWMNQRELRGS